MRVSTADTHVPDMTPIAERLFRTRSTGGLHDAGSGVRPASTPQQPRSLLLEEAKHLPVLAEVDVLVCGGGPAGTAAAIAAARAGASTLLVERYGFLGGMATAGLVVPHFNPHLNRGLNGEIIRKLDDLDAWGAEFWKISFDPEKWKHVSEELVLDAGADLLYHAHVTAAIVDGDTVRGAVIETKSGRFALYSRVVVDCTGDGDVAARAGASYDKGRESDGLMQSMTTMFRLGGVQWVQRGPEELWQLMDDAIRSSSSDYRLPFEYPWAIHLPNPDEIAVQLVHIRGVDGTDVRDLTLAEIEGRRQALTVVAFLHDHVPGFENSYLIDTAAQVGVRETRRIRGEYTVTIDDIAAGRHFDDSVASVSFPIDIHESDSERQTVRSVARSARGAYDIPLRAMIPLGLENILVAGRAISGTYEAHASYRVKGPCVAMGQGAGVAAATAALAGASVRETPFAEVRSVLEGQGVRFWDANGGERIVTETENDPHARRRPISAYRGPG